MQWIRVVPFNDADAFERWLVATRGVPQLNVVRQNGATRKKLEDAVATHLVVGEEVLTNGATVFDVTFPEAGEVTLSAALEYADGDPLDPPVEASIGLTITP